ncbi:MAG TPA: HEAT repeat domain-containing protein [Planctomycetota bacterium]|nr:HEAT repeat domain-containing protein [Planctomycetota bacterium]
MPSSRRKPEPGAQPPKRPSSRRPGAATRGVGGHEREELLSEPPEYQSGERLDTIGLETNQAPAPRTASGRRLSDRHKQEPSSASRREKQEWAQAKVKHIKTAALVAVGLGVLGFLAYVPVMVRNDRISQLYDKNPAVRLQAAVNTGELGSGLDKAADIVRRCQKAEDLDGAGGAAALALAKAGAEGLSRLTALAEDQNPWARLCATYGLGLTGRPEAAVPLAKRLADSEGLVKVRAAVALGSIRSVESVKALVTQAQAAADVRDAAVASIYAIACAGSPTEIAGRAEMRPELVKGLGAPAPQMRQACGRTLIMLNEVPSDAELLERVASENPAIKAAAVEFLGLVGGSLFDVTIPKALADKAAEVRAAAASAAGLRRWAGGAEALGRLAASADEPVEVRAAAAEALGLIGRLEDAPALAKCLTLDASERSVPARLNAARALAVIGRANPPVKLTAPKEANEYNDFFTHLKLSAGRVDPRWAALEILIAGCDSFGEKVGPEAFEAIGLLARRTRAAKPEMWKPWMVKKQEEAKALSRLSQLFEEAHAECLKNKKAMTPDAIAKFKECSQILAELSSGCEEDDKWFYTELKGDFARTVGPEIAGSAKAPAPAKTGEQPPAAPKPE